MRRMILVGVLRSAGPDVQTRRMDSAYATAADLTTTYHVGIKTIYNWASRDNWRRTRTRPRGYLRADAQRSFDRRHRDHLTRKITG